MIPLQSPASARGFLGILRHHFCAYPRMSPQDAVKLAAESAGLPALPSENSLSPRRDCGADAPLLDPVSAKIVRVHLPALRRLVSGLSEETLGRMVPVAPRNQERALKRKLGLLLALTETGAAPFTAKELSDYLKTFDAAGRFAPAHSGEYLAAYRPDCRLVSSFFPRFFPLFAKIDSLLRQKPFINIGIDGCCGAGKSTLGDAVREIYGGRCIPADHFFLPAELRDEERLQTPGGNIHYERFLREAAPSLRVNAPVSYRVFDCQSMAYTETRTLPPGRVSVVEGSYSLRPDFRDLYDVRVFLTVHPRRQLERIARRNGRAALDAFIGRWIPMEQAYFEATGIPDACDFIIDTTK